MAKQPEDLKTPDLFGPDLMNELNSGHPGGRVSVGQFATRAALERIGRFRQSRKLFPVVTNGAACEVCGRKHTGEEGCKR